MISYANEGSQVVCGVEIDITVPDSLVAKDPVHAFDSIVLSDSNGNIVNSVDSSGTNLTIVPTITT